jgi:hypothetical protein
VSPAPHLRIVYRSTGTENGKPRPEYYSKMLGLASLLRAADRLPFAPEIVFLNDGRVSDAVLDLQHDHGAVHGVDGGSNRRSFRAAVARAAAVPAGGPDEIVWFAEDDYLYAPEAFTTLMAAAERFPVADYFSLYGSDALDASVPGRRPVMRPEKGAAGDPRARAAGAATWYRAHATTSTFGVRAPALRQDARLLRLMPWTGGAWDTATCLALQGYRPFRAADLLPDAAGGVVRTGVRGLVRAGAGLRSARRESRRRVQLGADPELIWHMELLDGTTRTAPSALTARVDWGSLAIDTMFWAADRGIAVPAPGSRRLAC